MLIYYTSIWLLVPEESGTLPEFDMPTSMQQLSAMNPLVPWFRVSPNIMSIK